MVLWHSFPYRAPTAPPLSGVDPDLAAEPQASSLLPLSESAGLGWLFVAFRFFAWILAWLWLDFIWLDFGWTWLDFRWIWLDFGWSWLDLGWNWLDFGWILV